MKTRFLVISIFLICSLFSACKKTNGGVGDKNLPIATEITEDLNIPQGVESTQLSADSSSKLNEDELAENTNLYLKGIIGDDMNVHMNISIKNGKVTGQYYYDKIREKIDLSGEIRDNNVIWMQEEHGGKYTGTIIAVLSEDNTMNGVWTYYDNYYYPLYLVDSTTESPEYNRPSGEILKFEGEWTGINNEHFAGSWLKMVPITEHLIYFDLSALSGENTGNVGGFATFEDDIVTFEAYNAEIGKVAIFKFSQNSDRDIYLDCDDYEYNCGIAVRFDSVYTQDYSEIKRKDTIGSGLTNAQEEAIKNMTGKYYEFLVEYSQTCDITDNLDGFDAEVYVIGIVGWRNAGIIMINKEDNTIMVAINYNRVDDLGIKYFTNSPNFEKPPKTIQAWIAGRDFEWISN